MHYEKTRNITYSGIAVALIVLSLYAGSIIKNNKIFFLALSTYFGALPIIKGRVSIGIISYAASSILSLIIIPNKLYAGVYTIVGIYPIVKLLCEKRNLHVEFILKYIWFNAAIISIYFIYKNVIVINKELFKYSGIILIIIFEVLFFVYDYIFTKFIMFIQDRILKKIDSV